MCILGGAKYMEKIIDTQIDLAVRLTNHVGEVELTGRGQGHFCQRGR